MQIGAIRSWDRFPVRAAINQLLSRDVHKAERVIGGDSGTLELQLEATVEIEPESI